MPWQVSPWHKWHNIRSQWGCDNHNQNHNHNQNRNYLDLPSPTDIGRRPVWGGDGCRRRWWRTFLKRKKKKKNKYLLLVTNWFTFIFIFLFHFHFYLVLTYSIFSRLACRRFFYWMRTASFFLLFFHFLFLLLWETFLRRKNKWPKKLCKWDGVNLTLMLRRMLWL